MCPTLHVRLTPSSLTQCEHSATGTLKLEGFLEFIQLQITKLTTKKTEESVDESPLVDLKRFPGPAEQSEERKRLRQKVARRLYEKRKLLREAVKYLQSIIWLNTHTLAVELNKNLVVHPLPQLLSKWATQREKDQVTRKYTRKYTTEEKDKYTARCYSNIQLRNETRLMHPKPHLHIFADALRCSNIWTPTRVDRYTASSHALRPPCTEKKKKMYT